MSDTPQSLLNRAAHCYLRSGWVHEAARCYREAGAYRRAAEAWESVGAIADAAADFATAGLATRAAWLLVHDLGDATEARDLLASAADAQAAGEPAAARTARELLRRIVLARCDVADGSEPDAALATLDDVMDHLERNRVSWHVPELEPWAVAVAEAMVRPDLVALIYAAAVRGGQVQAAERWDAWSQRVLGVPLQLPDPDDDAATRIAFARGHGQATQSADIPYD